jgi:hypothetical protein
LRICIHTFKFEVKVNVKVKGKVKLSLYSTGKALTAAGG